MLTRILLVALALTLGAQTYGQLAEPTHKDDVPVLILPALDNLSLNKQYNKDQGNKPFRFAEARDVSLSILEDGLWEKSAEGRLIWRQAIESKNAYSINLAFTSFKLAGDAELYIFNEDKSDLYGPFTEKDNDDHEQLWTPLVSGDRIYIHLEISPEYLKSTKLEVGRVNHDFADVQKGLQSGSCNLDVACGAADGWPIVDRYREIISSVGAYTLNGIDQCSGVLINNTAQDCKPLFLTANHCNVGPGTSQSIVVYWNYENSTCRQPDSFESGLAGDGQRNTFNSGSTHLASLFDSDFTLLELDDPIDPTLNLFFSGWDLSYELPDTSICVHHPAVEEKRISFEFDRLEYDPTGQDTAYIQVNDWDIGTTEGGSSGSPLYNAEGRIIGQLLGGLAACGNDEYDTYGWIRYSFEGRGGVTNSLKHWLDPLGLGPEFLDGRSCSFNLDVSNNFFQVCGLDTDAVSVDLFPSEFFESPVNYEIVSADAGLQLELDFIQGAVETANGLSISGLSGLPEDRYEIVVSVSDASHSAEASIIVDLFDGDPEVPMPSEPANNAEMQLTSLQLGLRRTINVSNEFEVSLDEDFNDVLFSTQTDERIFKLEKLDNDTRYYWRARSLNPCGVSEWSEVFSFKTAATFCTTFRSTHAPIEIPELNANTITSAITCPYIARIQDVNVNNVKGTHDYVGDLQISLEFNGDRVVLLDERCEDNNDFNLGFDDEAANSNISCPPTDSALYVPKDELSVFGGVIGGGDWLLNVDDLVNFDGGEFEEWTLELCISEVLDAALIPEDHYISYCSGQDILIDAFYDLGSTAVTDFEVRAFNRDLERLDKGFTELKTSLNTATIRLSTDGLADDLESVNLQLVALPSEASLAMAVINLVPNGSAASSLVLSPQNFAVMKPSRLTELSWNNSGARFYTVEMARDEAFEELVISESDLSTTSLDVSNIDFEDGQYFIRVIAEHDCGPVYSETTFITLDINSSVGEVAEADLTVYPNPGTGLYNVILPSSLRRDNRMEVFDLSGRRILSDQNTETSGGNLIDLSDVGSGLYLLRVETSKGVLERRLIKL